MNSAAFKSERVAKMAVSKADKALTAAMTKAPSLRFDLQRRMRAFPEGMPLAEHQAAEKAIADAEAAVEPARIAAKAAFDAAIAQGFDVHSIHFSASAHRDLVLENRD